MDIAIGVLSLFVLALIAPFTKKFFGSLAGWAFSIVPASLFFFFITLLIKVNQGEIIIETYTWIEAFNVSLSFYIDGLSVFFALLVLGIGTLILIYAGYYMKPYAMNNRFFGYLILFMGAMLGLVVSGNLITMFVFWELTSISSFLLIGFNHEKPEARAAALQALLITGVGGLALLGGALLLGHVAGTYEFDELLYGPGIITQSSLYTPILLLFLAGAFTKSAQFPFHFWLPGAMQAPSPVSAFLHSATMVKAGVFLLMRMSPILGGTELWHYLLSIFGALTMLTGAWMAIGQTDLKRILAYTTVSALGTLVLLIGTGTEYAINAAIIFLLVHALYKGTLFMMAGTLEKLTGTRDINSLGGLFKHMPIAAIFTFLAALSMAGLPPMLGFIGKELIYEAKAYAPDAAWFILLAGFIANVFTVFISARFVMDIFFGKEGSFTKKLSEPSLPLILGPAILVSLSLILGLLPKSLTSPFTSSAVSAVNPYIESIKLSLWHGFNLVLLLSIITVGLGITLFIFKNRFLEIVRFLNLKYFRQEYSKSFFGLIDSFLSITKKKTEFVQHGYHRFYLITVFLVASGLIWFQLAKIDGLKINIEFNGAPLYMIAVITVIIIATIITLLTSSRLVALISLGVIGFGVSIIFIVFSGVDLAITMIMIETLMVVLAMMVVYHLPPFLNYSAPKSRIRDAIIAVIAGSFMTMLLLQAGATEPVAKISDFFKANSYELAHGKNIVNVILVDFRAMDTLGEITVLSLAAIGVIALLKLNRKQN